MLGAILHHNEVAVRITEVEAYEGVDDPASHAWRGRTERNATMYGPPGRLYIYTMHGHACANLVSGATGVPTGLLLRAGAVIDGLAIARERRLQRRRSAVPDHQLARGPGNLTRCLDLTLADDGADLRDRPGPWLELRPPLAAEMISTGPRVGVPRAVDVPWRFWIAGDPSVSAFRAAKVAPRP